MRGVSQCVGGQGDAGPGLGVREREGREGFDGEGGVGGGAGFDERGCEGEDFVEV